MIYIKQKTTQNISSYKTPTNTNVKGALGGLAFLTATLASPVSADNHIKIPGCGHVDPYIGIGIPQDGLDYDTAKQKVNEGNLGTHIYNDKETPITDFKAFKGWFGSIEGEITLNCGGKEKVEKVWYGVEQGTGGNLYIAGVYGDRSSIGSNDKGSGKSSSGGGSGSSSGEDFGGGDAGGGHVDDTL